MKTENSTNATNANGPACADALTAEERAVHASVSVSAFVRRYPSRAVWGRIHEIAQTLAEYYFAHGFTVVRWSNVWADALRQIEPGHVWLVWAPGHDLRVLGMMKGGNAGAVPCSVGRAFFRRVDRGGKCPRVAAVDASAAVSAV